MFPYVRSNISNHPNGLSYLSELKPPTRYLIVFVNVFEGPASLFSFAGVIQPAGDDDPEMLVAGTRYR